MSELVFERVVACIVRTFHPRSGVTITTGTTSEDIAGWDSLTYTMLILAVEDEFGVELPFEEIRALANVGDLATLVCRLEPPA